MTKLIVALDVKTFDDAKAIVDELIPQVEYFKVGSTLHTVAGKEIIDYIKSKDAKVFLDLKFFDIPHQVRGVSFSAADLGADMFTIHLLGGREMIKGALDGVFDHKKLYIEEENIPLVLGVTVLTSMNAEILKNDLRIDLPTQDMVLHLAQMGYDSGVRGFVCSPFEIEMMKSHFPDITLVTPGVRLKGDNHSDQKRVMTPREAKELGSDFIVMGRSVYQAADKFAVVDRILEELS